MSLVLFDEAAVGTAAGARLVDQTIDRYVAWREECAALGEGYEQWASALGPERVMRFAAYNAALDREECAARLYAASVKRLSRFLWPNLDP